MSTLPPHACRLRVRYTKDGRLAYLGHLEVMNTVMRSVRRAGLPFEVGNGFARRMRIQFSQALPVGASSQDEYYDLLLSEPIDAASALVELAKATPRALAPVEAAILPRRLAALEAWADLSEWQVCVRSPKVSAKGFDDALTQLMAIGSIDYLRGERMRHLELDGLVERCDVTDVDGGVDLVLRTRTTDHGSLRPAVLVRAAVGCDPLRVCRTMQCHVAENGLCVRPMEQAGRWA